MPFMSKVPAFSKRADPATTGVAEAPVQLTIVVALLMVKASTADPADLFKSTLPGPVTLRFILVFVAEPLNVSLPAPSLFNVKFAVEPEIVPLIVTSPLLLTAKLGPDAPCEILPVRVAAVVLLLLMTPATTPKLSLMEKPFKSSVPPAPMEVVPNTDGGGT